MATKTKTPTTTDTKQTTTATTAPATETTATLDPKIGMNAQFEHRYKILFEARHYKTQTNADLWQTILNAGIKAIEKRRKGTEEAKIERAMATLKAAGKLPEIVETEETVDEQEGKE